ncbi:MAG: YhbY family RNA-binding protein, partial [Spirochaetales bacterium]|nr:YhbY family RNA-binding protein [Spirochaetales bacterium]
MEMKGYQRSYLTKLAHEINPQVMVGGNGLTEAVINQTDEMLEQHELVKIRFQDYKNSKDELSREL